MPNLQIPLPPPPSWSRLSPQDTDSPYVPFFTPPETPSPSIFYTPPQSPATPHPPHPVLPPVLHPPAHTPSTDDPFPAHVDPAVDLPFDDDNLSTLEKIYLYSRSKAPYHRVFIAHALPQYLHSVSPQDAVAYVLPLLSGLAMDDDEHVKEAFAAELVPVVWWFFSHCQVIPDELDAEQTHASSSTTVTISVQAFTPILGTLLLSPNPLVGGAARFAVVDLLSRMKRADDRERELHGALRAHLDLPAAAPVLPAVAALHASAAPLSPALTHQHYAGQTSTHTPREPLHPWEIVPDDDDDVEDPVPLALGLFGHAERALFTQEILHQVVIGMGRLDDVEYDDEDQMDEGEEQQEDDEGQEGARMATDEDVSPRPLGPVTPENQPVQGSSNPYFPSIASQQTSLAQQEAAQHAKYSAMPWYSPPVVASAASSPATQSPSGSTTGAFSPGVEYPSSPSSTQSSRSSGSGYLEHFSSSGPGESIFQPPESARGLGNVPSAMEVDYNNWEGMGFDDGAEDEQAAVGRLSSMSLMAAVTASGTLDVDTQHAFVEEVQRVGGDSVYWVRREASFALGALAKVVPEHLVTGALLPLFDNLRRDPVWHVRHSVLFALPAVLERLAPDHRKRVALETITGLARDQSPAVRSGVLEALGEVIHTFHGDPGGPPGDLLALFLGIRDGSEQSVNLNSSTDANAKPALPSRTSSGSMQSQHSVASLTSEVLYDDPKRNLICAFNFPAVALTLGAAGWPSLRDSYLAIAADTSTGVRRTLAASLGELARIIGPASARADLVSVWHVYIRAEEEEVRSKAIETLSLLMSVAGGREVGRGCLHALVRCWEEGLLRGWREREMVVRGLVRWLRLVGVGNPQDLDRVQAEAKTKEEEERGGESEMAVVAKRLLMKGLEDNVAVVRESSVLVTPDVWQLFSEHVPALVDELDSDLRALAASPNYRRRMTFVGCRQALALALGADDRPLVYPSVAGPPGALGEADRRKKDDAFLRDVAALATDGILGVRIGVARFAGTVHDHLVLHSLVVPTALRTLVNKLARDTSSEVRAYVVEAAKTLLGVEQSQAFRSAIAAIPLASPRHPVGGTSASAAGATAASATHGEGSGDSFPSNTSTASSSNISVGSSTTSPQSSPTTAMSARKHEAASRATFSRPPPALIVSPSPRSASGSRATSRSRSSSSSQTGYFDLVVPKRPSSALSNHSAGSGPSGGSSGGGAGESGGGGLAATHVSANWASLGLGQSVTSPLGYSPGPSGYSGSPAWASMGSVAAKKSSDSGTPVHGGGSASASASGGSGSSSSRSTAPASSNKPPSHRDAPMDG